jgi:hypothetical protein
MRRFLAVLAMAWGVASAAHAFNHTLVSAPLSPLGPHKVACTNIEHDVSRIVAGATPTDYWEGHLVNDRLLYIDQILAAPQTAVRFDALVPDRSEYPNTRNTRVPFVAVVCHPTPATNTDPDYTLPGTTDFVPRMQRAGAAPKIASGKWPLIVYSHGLGGSPVGKGYLQSIALLASHGFVVPAVFHADARFSRIRAEDFSDYWYVLTQYDRIAEMQLMRPVALKAMLDVLLANPDFAPSIDADRIGGFGASLGGQAMANLLGARLTTSLGGACRETVRDPRIKAAFTFVPYAGQPFIPAFCEDQGGAEEVTRPFFAMSGTSDTTAPLRCVRDALDRMKGTRYLVELTEGQHELRAEDIGDLFTWMIAFYRGYLLDDPAGYAALFRMQGVTGGREDRLTMDVHVPQGLAPNEVRVTELRNDRLGRYFLEPDPAQVDAMLKGSAGEGWALTGHAFKALALPPAIAEDACHYEGTVRYGSNLYVECGWTQRLGRWQYDADGDFYAEKPDAAGRCRDGLLAVNRLYHPRWALNRTTSNQRYVTSDSEARAMIAEGWIALPPTMCARP